MYLLSKEANRHLLDFLRNLTPQALLLSTALILYALWRRNDSAIYLVLCFGIATIFVMAAVANANNFLDNAFSHSSAIATERDRLKGESPSGRASVRRIIHYIWIHKRATLFEFVVALAVIYGALFTILITAVASAVRVVE